MRLTLIFIIFLILVGFKTNKKILIITGKKIVESQSSDFKLKDIAKFTVIDSSLGKEIDKIKNLVVLSSIKPAEERTISSSYIIDKLKEQDINLNSIGYVLPSTIKCIRTSRNIEESLFINKLTKELKKRFPLFKIEKISFNRNLKLPLSSLKVSVGKPVKLSAVEYSFPIVFTDDFDDKYNTNVNVYIARYKHVLSSVNFIPRNSVIGKEDIKLTRVNVLNLSSDLLSAKSDVIGKFTTKPISPNELFRSSYTKSESLVKAGSAVILTYRKGSLKATAKGVSLVDGAKGDEIKIRNSSSNNIVEGVVVGRGQVEVTR
jgi:flagella basal body P-ring formation protein FlgA